MCRMHAKMLLRQGSLPSSWWGLFVPQRINYHITMRANSIGLQLRWTSVRYQVE